MFTYDDQQDGKRDAEAVSPYLERPLRSLEEVEALLAQRRAAYDRAVESSKSFSEQTKLKLHSGKPRIVWNRDRAGGGRRDQSPEHG